MSIQVPSPNQNRPAAPNFKAIEYKWQQAWDVSRAFEAKVNAEESTDSSQPKYYVLEMFPYPSGKMHMGHVRNYMIGDLITRYKVRRGFNVLHPFGWDAFGLPAENAAIDNGVQPQAWTESNIASMKAEMKSLGFSYDWSRELCTASPDYYKHEQKIFLDFLKKGIAYKKSSFVNWDPVDQTVLANEQVVDGRGWRSGEKVVRKKLSQWFFKITDYAEELLDNLPKLTGWPEEIRLMQEKWIGKSYGCNIDFRIKDSSETIKVFSTLPETIFGGTFLAISFEHPLAVKLAKTNAELAAFINECLVGSVAEADLEKMEKLGFDTGLQVECPARPGTFMPVFVANFVLMEYGTGAVFGCPAHDARDYEFAQKYDLPILNVLEAGPDAGGDLLSKAASVRQMQGAHGAENSHLRDVHLQKPTCTFGAHVASSTGATQQVATGVEFGKKVPVEPTDIMTNSEFLNGLTASEAKQKIISYFEQQGRGQGVVNYRLRDWGVSRQRYWGCPIPIIRCDACGDMPVPESDLPVTLPMDVDFSKKGNPLDNHPTWKHVKCPACGADAIRETDTFDTFVDSSWYFARFCNSNTADVIDKQATDYWMPVDQYIGGAEHAVMHLLYARFFMKAMRDCGYFDSTDLGEPFKGLFNQGMITHMSYQDSLRKWVDVANIVQKDGEAIDKTTGRQVFSCGIRKMSKSYKNVVAPAEAVAQFGADTVRMFSMSDTPPGKSFEWTDAGIRGVHKFVCKLYEFVSSHAAELREARDAFENLNLNAEQLALRRVTHRTISNFTKFVEDFHFNRAIATIRELTNELFGFPMNTAQDKAVVREATLAVISLLNPLTPHITEDMWEQLSQAAPSELRPASGVELLARTDWPHADAELLRSDTIQLPVQVNGKLRAVLDVSVDDASAGEDAVKALVLNDEKVQRAIGDKMIKKFIYVPGRVVNIVV